MPRTFLRLAPFACLPLLWSCAEGGNEERLTSDVPIQADHHLVGIIARASFGTFPVSTDDTAELRATLRMLDDSTYTVFDGSTTLSAGDYYLDETAELSLLVPTSGATQVFRGAYELVGERGALFLTDRVGNGIGVQLGIRQVDGTPDINDYTGDWHLFSTHVLYADGLDLPDTDLVGRAFGGSLLMAADGSFTGLGVESTNNAANLPISGAAGAFAGFDRHEFDFTVTYGSGATSVNRVFHGGGGPELIVAVDEDSSDGADGLSVLMKKRDAGAVDLEELAGTYTLGFWTVFAHYSRPGSDAAIGTLELTSANAFRAKARSNDGQDFAYTGTYTAADDGTLVFTVASAGNTQAGRPQETWVGAFDNDYQTIALVDNFKEQRTGALAEVVELSLGIAVRRQDP